MGGQRRAGLPWTQSRCTAQLSGTFHIAANVRGTVRSQPRRLHVAVLLAYIRGLLLEVDRTLNQELGDPGSS